jgi:hypothetical protein
MIWRLLVLATLLITEGRGQTSVMAGTDVDGRSVALLPPGHSRAVVLYFLASDCPISNRTVPEMKRVQEEFAGRGVQFWFVYPNSTQTPQSVHEHLSEFGLGDVALIDPHERLARMTGAKWTPEAAVLVPAKGGLRTVYVGRVDDRYVGIGKQRPQANVHDLEAAVAAVLAGKQPKPPGGPSVGCGIVGAP